jgi:tetratricopeptide (TPR) repeat protein
MSWGGSGWARMREEHDNLGAALDHALERARRSQQPSDVDAGFQLANGMVWFWQYNRRYEGVEALKALLALPGGSPACRAAALQGLAMFSIYYPTPASRAAARESLALFEQLGDTRGAALSRLLIAWEAQYGGDLGGARALVAAAEAVLGRNETPGMQALLHYVKAQLELGAGAFEASIHEWRLALDRYRQAEDRVIESAVLAHLGLALRETGRIDEALTDLQAAVDLVNNGETLHGLAFALVNLAHAQLDVGADSARVRELLARGDDVARRAQNPRCQAWAAWGRARLALAAGNPSAAVEECLRATTLFQDREFPFARAQLWALLAEAADAAGNDATAGQARARARSVNVTSS